VSTTPNTGLDALLRETREAAELCEPLKTGADQRVRCAGCGWTGLLDTALEASHGNAVCPECDSRQLRNVEPTCGCGQELKNTANTERG
jgi:hypothetical protein